MVREGFGVCLGFLHSFLKVSFSNHSAWSCFCAYGTIGSRNKADCTGSKSAGSARLQLAIGASVALVMLATVARCNVDTLTPGPLAGVTCMANACPTMKAAIAWAQAPNIARKTQSGSLVFYIKRDLST